MHQFTFYLLLQNAATEPFREFESEIQREGKQTQKKQNAKLKSFPKEKMKKYSGDEINGD